MSKYRIGIGRVAWIAPIKELEGEFEPIVKAYKEAGIEFVRVIVGTAINRTIFPYKVTSWNNDLDSDKHPCNPNFVEEWDEEWWGVFEKMLMALKKYELSIDLSLIDASGILYATHGDIKRSGKFWWTKLWNCSSYSPEFLRIENGEVKGHFLPQLDRIFGMVRASGVSYRVEVVNEFSIPCKTDAEFLGDNRYLFIRTLAQVLKLKYGITSNQCIYSGDNYIFFRDICGIYSVHNVSDQHDVPQTHPANTILSGDGCYRVMNILDGREVAAKMVACSYFEYEFFYEGYKCNTNSHWNTGVPAAMRKYLDAYEPKPEPEPPTPPPAPPEPPKPESWWKRFIRWIKGLFR
jgi:hypothetical protein